MVNFGASERVIPQGQHFLGDLKFSLYRGDLQLVNFELQRIFEKCGPIHKVVFGLFSANAIIGLCISVYFTTDCLSLMEMSDDRLSERINVKK